MLAGLAWALPAMATDVLLVGLAGAEKAVLLIDGRRVVLAKGEEKLGIRLREVEAGAAVIESEGKTRRLRLGERVAALAGTSRETITLVADQRGHFVALGAINGAPMRFLVDTGATVVAIGATDARRAGIDPTRGEVGVTLTANGPTVVRRVRLPRLTLAGVTLHDVEAAVHEHDLPVALLGMSALNRFEIRRDGETLTLTRRY